MEASRTRKSRPRPSVRRSKKNVKEDDVRSEVAEVLDGLVYITESVANLEGVPLTKSSASRPKSLRPKASQRKKKANDEVRKEVKSVLDGLVYTIQSVAKLEREPKRRTKSAKPRTQSVNSVTKRIQLNSGPTNGPKSFTNKITKMKSIRRSRKSESDVMGIKI